MKDLYQLLGVTKSAAPAEVKAAYRKLAKKLHPDVNQGNESIAEKFKEVSAAYAIIGDKGQRAKYDAGQIDASGAMHNPFAGAGPDARHSEVFEEILRNFGGGGGRGGASTFEFSGSADDIFSDLFSFGRGGGRRGQRTSVRKGDNVIYNMHVSFLEAAQGTKRRLSLQNGKTLDVKIPEGVSEGQQIRLRGQGGPGIAGGPAGDALIHVHIEAHHFFIREGSDIFVELPITVDEAVLGGKVHVPTISGPVSLKIPKGTSSGKRFRLKGKGVKHGRAHGDQYVTVQIALPAKADKELEKAIKAWRDTAGYKVRQKYGVD